MVGTRIPDDASLVQHHLTSFQLCDLGLREISRPGGCASAARKAGDAHATLMGYVKLLPGARGLVALARIGAGGRATGLKKESPAPHVAEARELLTNLLPVATWHALARIITLGIRSPEQERGSVNAMAKDLRPRLHRTIRCAAVVDPDAAVRLMLATSALTVAWTDGLCRHGAGTALMAGVADLVLDLDSLNVLDTARLGEPGPSYEESILFSPRRREGAVLYDRWGIATREQAGLRDLAACVNDYGGRIVAMRETLPWDRYTFARLLLRQGRNHSRDLSRAASARCIHRLRQAQETPRVAAGGRLS